MYWIIHVGTIPPPQLLYEPSIANDKGETCAMFWIYYQQSIPPPELLHNPDLVNIRGLHVQCIG